MIQAIYLFFSYAVYIFSCIKASNISPFTPDYKSL